MVLRLLPEIIDTNTDAENLRVLGSKNEDGKVAVVLTYKTRLFDEDLPDLSTSVNIHGMQGKKQIKIWTIDRTYTNPYGVFLDKQYPVQLSDAQIKELQEVATLRPEVFTVDADGIATVPVHLSINGTMLIETE